ncbi:MAG: nucleotide exchange factor GrpE, partial [Clostridia bacterium]|nr:nucleotide exchange factor GrpE [Clostridia bacterium]
VSEGAGEETEADRDEVAALRRACEAERARVEELQSQMLRLRADYDNFRRRMLTEQSRWQEAAVAAFATAVLPVLDNLERAAAAPAENAESLRQGIDLVLRQFRDVLAREGIEPVPAVGERFDPNRHEAIAREESDACTEERVVEEYQKGYVYRGRLLRPSLVKVAVPAARRPDGGADEEGVSE